MFTPDVGRREADRLVDPVDVGLVVGDADRVDGVVVDHQRVADRNGVRLVVAPAQARDQEVLAAAAASGGVHFTRVINARARTSSGWA